MNVQQYLFQSPYNSSVQVGRPDPSSKQEDVSNESSDQLDTNVKQQQPEHQLSVDNEVTTESVSPVVSSSNQLLDVYA